MSETEPVKYFQGETKRLNYYNSQFLKEEDFRDEQLYHGQMRRFHNRSLHTWGVVAGLEVRPVAGARKVTVTPGMAIDRLGREIVLAREIVLPPESVPPQDAEADAVGFDAFDAGSTVYLTIKYREVFDPADKDTQSKNYRRTTERPLLALSAAAAAPAADAPEVVLAAVALDGDKAIARVGAEVRRYAGSRFGTSADGKEFSIYADTAGAWHFFDGAKGADRLTFDGKGNVGIGTNDPGVSKLKIAKSATDFAHLRFQGDDAGMGEFEIVGWRDGWNINTRTAGKNLYLNRDTSSDILIGPSGKETIVKGDSGKVGIGTTSPAASLHVGSGAIQVGTGAEESFTTLIDHSITHKFASEVNPRYKIDRDLLGGGKAGIGFGFLNFSIEAGGAAVGIPATRNLAFYTSDANQLVERVRIDGSGNVGIGTTRPLSALSISSVPRAANVADQVIGELTFVGFDRPKASASILAQSKNWDDTSHLIFKTSDSGAGAQERMRITSDGRVGIGNASPPFKLSMTDADTIATGVLRLQNSYLGRDGNNSANFGIELAGIDNGTNGHELRIRGRTSATGSFSDLVTVKNDGNVAIKGTLDVDGRILRKGQDFSLAGSANHDATVTAPWGKREDWNILVSPRYMGAEEANSEGDNALLVIECRADEVPTTNASWKVFARFKYRYSNNASGHQWYNGTANYLLVPR